MNPPTSPPPVHQPYAQSNWPLTFGILGLLLSVVGFIGAAYQALMCFAMGQSHTRLTTSVTSGGTTTTAGVDEAVTEEFMALFADVAAKKIYVEGGLCLLAVILFVGSILLMCRYRIARPIMTAWAYAKIGVGLLAVYFTQKLYLGMMSMTEEMAGTVSGAAGMGPLFPEKLTGTISVVIILLGAIWVSLYPVLLLIWMGKESSRLDMQNGYGWK